MPKLNVYNQNGEVVGDIQLNEAVFAIEPNEQVVYDAVRLFMANGRQATAKTKKRDEVRGGGRKPWRQKGTGRARQGSTRSPQWRHGGIVFGPNGEQDYSLSMNRKERQLALKSVLSQKVKDQAVIIVDKMDYEQPKTKQMIASLASLKATGKTLIVVDEFNFGDNAVLSAMNLPSVGLLYSDQINVYDVLNCDSLVFTQAAVQNVEEVLLSGKN